MNAQEIAAKFGRPPSPTKVVFNPDYERWIERISIWLCTDEHEADAIPCSEHRSIARRFGNELAPGMAVAKVATS